MSVLSTIPSVDYVNEISALFGTHRNDTDAHYMSKYMKGHFQFYGLKAGPRRNLQKVFLQNYGLPSDSTWRDICRECWVCEEREMQLFGMELAFKMKKKWVKEDVELIAFLIVNKSWWDTVDFIASNIAGYYFKTYPEEIPKTIPAWNNSDNMWLIRTSIIFQLKYNHDTNFDLLKKVIHPHLSSNEFFIQKAIGWALRQYARFQPELVKNFVTETNLKPLSKREAMKHLE